jgi:Protein of unknown function (DUF3892)
MSQFQVVCTEQTPISSPRNHAHITAVGTGSNPDKAAERWTLQRVVHAIDVQGHTFYTVGRTSGKVALVETINCPAHCGERIIRSAADAVSDNNLDNLRTCRF